MVVPFATALERRSLLDAAQEGAAAYSPGALRALARAIRELPEGDTKTMERQKLRAILDAAKSMRGQAKKPMGMAGFDAEDKQAFRAAVNSNEVPEPNPTTFQRLTHALDTPLRGVRFLAESAAGIRGDSYKTSETFHRALETEAAGGNDVAQKLDTLRGAGVGAALGTVASFVPQLRGAKVPLQIGGAALGAAVSGQLPDTVKRLGFDLAADPLNLVKTVSGAETIGRHLADLGVDASKASEFAKSWASTPGAYFRENYPKFIEEASKLGPTAEALMAKFGQTGEWLGRAETGLGLGNNVATLGQRPGRLLDKAATRAGRAIGVLDETKTFAQRGQDARTIKALGRQSRAIEHDLRERIGVDALDVAKAAKGISPERYTELVARYLDPGQLDPIADISKLAPEEANLITKLDGLFTKYAPEVEGLGVELAHNPKGVGGGYYPRAFGDAFGRGGDTDQLISMIRDRAAKTAKMGVSAPNLKARTGDVAWGDVFGPNGVPTDTARNIDPSKVAPSLSKDLASYGRQLSGAKAYNHLRDSLLRNFAKADGTLEPQAEQYLVQSFDNMSRAIEAKVGKWRNPDGSTLLDKAMSLGAESLDTFHRLFKINNLVYRFPYHVANVFGDSTMMAVNGINPVSAWTKARDLVKQAESGVPEAKALLAQAKANNVGLSSAFDRLEFSSLTRSGAEEARLKRAAGQSLGPVADVVAKVGETIGKTPVAGKLPRISEVWEQYSKLGAWLDGIEKGLSPENSAKRVFDILLDYGQPGKSPVQNVVLFWNYLSQAAGASARTLAEQPAAWMAPQKIAENVSDPNAGPAARWMEESGPAVALRPGAKALASTARQTLGGAPFDADTFVSPRFGNTEGLALPFALADSALDATNSASVPQATIRLARFATPPVKYLAEAITGRDALTGGERDPGPAASLGAAEIPADVLMRVIAPALLPSPIQAGANQLVAAAGGPATLIGRPDSIDPRPENALFSAALGQVSPWAPREVTPTARYYEQTNSPATTRYKAELERIKKNIRERQALARRKKQ